MHIYFSGLGGVGIGPLAEIAHNMGYLVSGSDLAASPMTAQLARQGVNVSIGQDGSQIAAIQAEQPIDWFVYSSALPNNHPELSFALKNGIKTSKRDELINEIIRQKKLKLLAVAGTHGKTTTTAMLVWVFKQLGIPISYSVGTTLSFGPSGQYDPKSEYFVYECDEFDRNFLNFKPFCSLITSLDYDHFDTYPTQADYAAAFANFITKSQQTFIWNDDVQKVQAALGPNVAVFNKADLQAEVNTVALPGLAIRQNAFLAACCLQTVVNQPAETLIGILSNFPGTARRFEKLANNFYSDYAHHPAEIAATLQMAAELNNNVVVVYQPHQNRRQQQIKANYGYCFNGAAKLYWLPTYLSRENPAQPVLTPQELATYVKEPTAIVAADLNDDLWNQIQTELSQGALVVLMSAGNLDAWARQNLSNNKPT